MPSKPTVPPSDEVDQGPPTTVGGGAMSRWLEAEYRAMADDTELDQEAVEWIEFAPDEALV